MASEREYLEKLTTGQLTHLLEQDLPGRGQYGMGTVYLICTVLSERNPGHGSPKEVFLRFCEAYADTNEDPPSY